MVVVSQSAILILCLLVYFQMMYSIIITCIFVSLYRCMHMSSGALGDHNVLDPMDLELQAIVKCKILKNLLR